MITDALRKLAEGSKSRLPAETIKIMEENTEALAVSQLKETAIKIGEKMPAFKLTNALGKTIESDDLLSKGPLVINFYRGGW